MYGVGMHHGYSMGHRNNYYYGSSNYEERRRWSERDDRQWRATTQAPYFENKVPGGTSVLPAAAVLGVKMISIKTVEVLTQFSWIFRCCDSIRIDFVASTECAIRETPDVLQLDLHSAKSAQTRRQHIFVLEQHHRNFMPADL